MAAMGPQENPEGRRTRWHGRAAGGAVVAAFCALVLWGLGWGIPSQRRARLEGASAARVRNLAPEAVQESWRIWGSRGRRDDAVADLFPRDLFNPVRSYHPDEYQVFKSLSNMRPRKLDFDPWELHLSVAAHVSCGCGRGRGLAAGRGAAQR